MTKKIGTAPNQIPVNGMLGDMAFQDAEAVNIVGGKVASDTLTGTIDKARLPDQVILSDSLLQTTGSSTDSPMSQAATTYALSGKVDKTNIVQESGQSTTAIMSQKAVTDLLEGGGSGGDSGASSSPLNLFSKPARGKPMLTKVSATSVSLPAGLSVATLGVAVTLPANITLTLAGNLKSGTATPGTDYFVYLKPDATAYISASDTEADARLIGGFHYGLTDHAEAPSGNKTEADMVKLRGINAYTFWDLTWRANKGTNRGLTFDGINWIDIYLADGEYAVRGWSKAGGWIAAGDPYMGREYPIIPEMFGGNGVATYGKLTAFVAWDMLNAAGMEPISYKQFSHAMYGVEEGLRGRDVETVMGKIEHYPRLTSRYGVEQATGVQMIWGADLASRTDRPNTLTWHEITDGRGMVYGLDAQTIVNVLLGGHRGGPDGVPGSRASLWHASLAGLGIEIGVRGLRDHLTLD